ncbi:MAG TPA: hypothetical protein VGM17_11505 [Rhizomicrobium sp.]|jgi:hypothetical protein
MKNITLAVDEEALRAARIYAAEHDTTVNALVREHLAKLAERSKRSRLGLGPDLAGAGQSIYRDDPPFDEEKAAQARRELVEMSRRSAAELGPDYKWNRAELYDREALRGHQRADLRGNGAPISGGSKAKSK